MDEVHARLDLQLDYPPTLQGSIGFVANPPRPVPTVSIRGRGQSEIIPGLTRTFEVTLSPTNDLSPDSFLQPDGTYTLAVNAGLYSISVSTLDPDIPPATTQVTTAARSGEISTLNLQLGALDAVGPVHCRVTTPPGASDLEVQAFSDGLNLRPLSQRLRVQSSGDSDLPLSPAVLLNPTFVVQVSPRDASALVPQKIFGPFASSPVPTSLDLPLGDYGQPVTVDGSIVDSNGAPILGATVYIEGPVGGGGTFRSQGVQTDGLGQFSLSTLRSAPNSSSTLWAIPPAQSASGILRSAVVIRGPGTVNGLTCPDKVIASGKVFKSDETPAPGVRVLAVPLRALTGRPLPGSGDQTVTEGDASFSLKLDPAIYRLDFIPGGQLPRTSRFAAVGLDRLPSGRYRPVELPDVFLSKGRRIVGTVTAVTNQVADSAVVAPLTALRFFRLTDDFDGRPSSVLLGEAISDANGNYGVNLPTR